MRLVHLSRSPRLFRPFVSRWCVCPAGCCCGGFAAGARLGWLCRLGLGRVRGPLSCVGALILLGVAAAAVPDDGFESCVGRDCPADASCPVTEPCVDVSCWTLPQLRSWAASRGPLLKFGACFTLRLMAEHAYCCLSVSLGERRPGACSAALAPSVSFADSPIGEGAACYERNAAL